jgi:hypothetical protein
MSCISLGMLIVIVTESFLSRDEWCTMTDVRAHIVGSSVILILSLENLFSDLLVCYV